MNEAAKALFISQPSLSGAVKELEKELGFELFLRTSRGIVVTPDGEEFLGYARQIIHDMDSLGVEKTESAGERIRKLIRMSNFICMQSVLPRKTLWH